MRGFEGKENAFGRYVLKFSQRGDIFDNNKDNRMYTFSVERFMFVEGDYKAGNLSQGQAVDELNKIYKAGLKEFKKRTAKIMKKYEFYQFVNDGIDGLISIYKNEPNMNLYSQIIKNFLEKIPTTPGQGVSANRLDFDQAMAAIYREREEIVDLCREKEYIEEYYNEYLAKIVDTPPQTNISDFEQHYFIQILKNDAKPAFEVIKKAIQTKLVEYKNDYFNFKCDKGCVGLIFAEAGYTDYKRISQHILINGEKCEIITLQNAKKNTPPAEWKNMSKIFFGTIK